MLVLGLDISTNMTGYSVIDENFHLLKYGTIDTSKKENWIEKANLFEFEISSKISPYNITDIGIEDILCKFTGGKSSAKTIISLARFNAIATLFCFQVFKKLPVHINVRRARSLAGVKIQKGEDSKEVVLNKVLEWYPDIILPKMKKKDSLDKSAYDITDSIIISRSMINERKTLDKTSGQNSG
jgi:Holliday junction resolvasome RuvABC endonuclease subunit